MPSEPLKQPLAAMLLLTRHPLPRVPHFPMYLEDGIEAQVTLENLEDTLEVDDEDLGLLTAFTMNAVFADVFNKVYQHDPSRMGYWLAPLAVESSKGSMHLA
ncbi:MAG: Dicer-like protein 1, partial [Watsoniomyces obsoletus]